MSQRSLVSLACFAAAAAWPAFQGTLQGFLLTPVERLALTSACGGPLHDGYLLFGHCSVCWAGSALLIAMGLAVTGPLLRLARR